MNGSESEEDLNAKSIPKCEPATIESDEKHQSETTTTEDVKSDERVEYKKEFQDMVDGRDDNIAEKKNGESGDLIKRNGEVEKQPSVNDSIELNLLLDILQKNDQGVELFSATTQDDKE